MNESFDSPENIKDNKEEEEPKTPSFGDKPVNESFDSSENIKPNKEEE